MFKLVSRAKNWSKDKIFCPPKSLKFNSFALILCWDNSNDFLMSYMIKTDVPCVFWSIWMFMVVSRTKNWSNRSKNSRFGHLNTKNPISQNPIQWTLQGHMMETDLPVCVLIWSRQHFFASSRPIFATGVQDKHLNRSKHTLAYQFPSYMTLDSH